MLPRIARLIFPKDDDVLLNYLHEEGVSIEPSWYMPIIPMVLVNGAEGIGTGWSTFVPNYNPRDIISNLKRLLKKENLVPMDPWYKGFKGSVKKRSSEESGSAYTVTGVIEQVSDTKLRITELPIHRWTYDYKDFLVSSCLNIQKEKSKHKNKEPPFLEDFKSYCDHETVNFEVLLSEQEMNNAKQEGLEKKFKLTDVIGTTNMHLFDPEGKIRKYDTPEDILEEFFGLRLEFYARRKQVMLEVLEKELRKLENRVRFIMALLAGDIIVNHSMLADLLLVLGQQRYDPFPKKAREEPIAVGDTERNDVSHGSCSW
ncbi:DNA topoisomerase 2-like [Triticum urartu]|uniref:DNA topoisomerase 2-like n=1 Tax=Triticum urartu TaxID=4572 RepID=UPI002044053F|nr:DNA topoisomerase 2-like [Triticum urartu]